MYFEIKSFKHVPVQCSQSKNGEKHNYYGKRKKGIKPSLDMENA